MPETTQASFVIEASVRDGFYAVKDAFIKIHGPMPPQPKDDDKFHEVQNIIASNVLGGILFLRYIMQCYGDPENAITFMQSMVEFECEIINLDEVTKQ